MGKTALAVTIAANAAAAQNVSAEQRPRHATTTTSSACSRSRCRPSSWRPGCSRARGGSSPTACAAATSPRRTGRRWCGRARSWARCRCSSTTRRPCRSRRSDPCAPAQADAGPRPSGGRLPAAAAGHRRAEPGQPGAGDHRDHPGPQGHGQGSERAGAGAVAAVAGGRVARGQAPHAVRPARSRARSSRTPTW